MAGYVNFGTALFSALASTTAVFLFKAVGARSPVQIAPPAVVGALMGFALGLLTLRMQGIFFSIADDCADDCHRDVDNEWRYVGGAAGIQMQRRA